MSPLLSVVVPFFNVEEYLDECLRSLENQSLTDLEIILVDDGSRDGSLAIAEAHAAGDPRIRIVRQENQGLGPARNTGVENAQGRYLTFVDSDDLVPRRAYELMVRSLEESGSDFAAGDARRFNNLGVRDSYVHRIPFARRRIATHVLDVPELALDRMAWNRVYRRSFYDEQRLEFPGMLYEDFPVSIKAHVRAKAVDVLSAPVYYWRERDGGDRSITQRTWELRNLRERVESAEAVLSFLHAEAPSLLSVVEPHLIHIDVAAVVAALHENDAGEHAEILDLANRLRDRMSPESWDAAIPFDRVQGHLIGMRDVPRLRALMDHRAEHGVTAPIQRVRRRPLPRRRGFYFQLPGLSEGVPVDLYRAPNHEIHLESEVIDAGWVRDRIEAELSLGVRFLPMHEDTPIRLWLEDDAGTRHPVPVLARGRGQRQHFPDDPCRVTVSVDPTQLAGDADSWWRLYAEIQTEGLTIGGPVVAATRGRARMFPLREIASGQWAQLQPRSDGLGVRLRRGSTAVAGIESGPDGLVLTGWFRGALPDALPMVRVVLDELGDVRELPVTLTGSDGDRHDFRVEMAGDSFILDADHDGAIEEGVTWSPVLRIGDEERLLTLAPDVPDVAVVRGVRRLTATRTITGNLTLRESFAGPVVHQIDWTDASTLTVSGEIGTMKPQRLIARRHLGPGEVREIDLPLAVDGDTFTTSVDISTLDEPGAPWVIWLDDGERTVLVTAARDAIGESVAPRRVDDREIRVAFGRSDRAEVLVS